MKPSPTVAECLVLPDRPVLADRIRVFGAHSSLGERYRIPICCRGHFLPRSGAGAVSGVVRWRQIGGWRVSVRTQGVVRCGLLHCGYSPHCPVTRLARIVVCNVALLLPDERARWMRQRAHDPGPVWRGLELEQRVVLSRAGWNGPMWWARIPGDSARAPHDRLHHRPHLPRVSASATERASWGLSEIGAAPCRGRRAP